MSDIYQMYVSSWNEHGGKPGLGQYTFDQDTGEIAFVESINGRDSFNFSLVDPGRNKLYVCNEVLEFFGCKAMSGRIFTYDLDPATGKATESARLETGCPNPSYISFDHTGKRFMIAHHSMPMAVGRMVKGEDGTYEVKQTLPEADLQLYAVDENGNPSRLLDNVNHSEGKTKEEFCHPHCCVVSPSGNLIAVADKGDGHLYIYGLSEDQNSFELKSRTLVDIPKASPRYVVFHPTKPFLFVNQEASYDGKNLYVTAYRYTEDGQVEKINMENAMEETVVPKGKTRLEQQCFVISKDGKYLYTLINDGDVIGVLSVDQETGAIRRIQNIGVVGNRPRGLAISPNGKFIITACLVGGELTSYKIADDGTLTVCCKGPSQPGASFMSFYKTK
jgi:6-phosphogluconolactonase (cycloisomerase 2 family)